MLPLLPFLLLLLCGTKLVKTLTKLIIAAIGISYTPLPLAPNRWLAHATTNRAQQPIHQPLGRLPQGQSLSQITVRGTPLQLQHGLGQAWTARHDHRYRALMQMAATPPKAMATPKIAWAVMSLPDEKILGFSPNHTQKFYGASVSKLYVGAAFLHQKKGRLTPAEVQILADMVVVSSNTAWQALQTRTGHGNNHSGQAFIQRFTENLGHHHTTSFRGWHGKLHGNEVCAKDMLQLLADTYHNRYQGAATLWQIMQTTRTATHKGQKYLPKNAITGGKTGTFRGYTINPDTQKPYFANVRHHAITITIGDHPYGVIILSDGLADEDIAIAAGGLFRELIKNPSPDMP